ncbi:MAG: hypothetical protein EXX96DRAFT_570116 [Benjaminiella poitrasii]|nr:MAG: hypothetical protein EXX96DRAFT_570116 [Benjaminiella poitrasii]
MNASIPCSGWLSKLTHSPFGTARWQSRFFVLLDTEMRYYKDEHSVTASKTINLHDISQIIVMTRTPGHPYVFRLEPISERSNKGYQKKVWTIECKSRYELDAWLGAIHLRLSKLSTKQEESGEQAGLVSPNLQPFSTPEQKRNEPPMSLLEVFDHNKVQKESAAAISPQPRLLKRSKPSISRRRGIILSPLDIEERIPILENDVLSSSSSRSSSLPSPISHPTTSSETIAEEEEDIEKSQIGRKALANKIVAQDAYIMDASSPTFVHFKERFNL